MIWLSWRQFRNSAVLAAVVLAAMAVVLAVSNPHAATGYLSRAHLLQFLSTALVGVPALIGAFWGAPLIARELEAGTFRLAWTQSVSRGRWLAFKLGLVGSAAVAFTGLFTLALTHWSSAAVEAGRFSDAMFGERGIAPMGYALFGLAVGATAGMVYRRTLPAMATTFVAFLAVRMVVLHWVRPHFASPVKLSRPFLSRNGGVPLQAPKGARVLSDNTINATGHAVNGVSCHNGVTSSRSQSGVRSVPPRLTPAGLRQAAASTQHCFAGFHEVLEYQPANRYWLFQGYETLIFVGLAAVLVGLCFWWVPRRLA